MRLWLPVEFRDHAWIDSKARNDKNSISEAQGSGSRNLPPLPFRALIRLPLHLKFFIKRLQHAGRFLKRSFLVRLQLDLDDLFCSRLVNDSRNRQKHAA